MCVYIYIERERCMRCRVKQLVQYLVVFVLKSGQRVVLKTGPSFVFHCFPIFIVFWWGMFKEHT